MFILGEKPLTFDNQLWVNDDGIPYIVSLVEIRMLLSLKDNQHYLWELIILSDEPLDYLVFLISSYPFFPMITT
jgi:hypothetical protein